jgi:hypothetical protein
MKLKHPINLHKGLTAVFVFSLMAAYQNFSTVSWIYLALHGGYGILWLLKDRIYPDKRWEEEIPLWNGCVTFILLGAYWIAPWLLVSRGIDVNAPILGGAVFLNGLGVFLHFGSDAQKYYALKYRPGLITDGFFARCRNPNYLGELMIYSSFALLTLHWLPFAILTLFVIAVFLPGMRQKERSLARYPEFAAYKAQSGFFLPNLFSRPLPPAIAPVTKSNP